MDSSIEAIYNWQVPPLTAVYLSRRLRDETSWPFMYIREGCGLRRPDPSWRNLTYQCTQFSSANDRSHPRAAALARPGIRSSPGKRSFRSCKLLTGI